MEIDELSRTIGQIEQGIKDLNKKLDEKFDALPCGDRGKDIAKLKEFQNNLQGKMTLIAAISVAIGGFLLWLAEEAIKHFTTIKGG